MVETSLPRASRSTGTSFSSLAPKKLGAPSGRSAALEAHEARRRVAEPPKYLQPLTQVRGVRLSKLSTGPFCPLRVALTPLQLQQDIAPKTGLKSAVANGYVF